jgi:NAD(P)H-dependent FMN reductase
VKLVAVVGSAVPSGKTRAAIEVIVRAAAECDPAFESDIIDLSRERVSLLDGRALDKYEDQTASVIGRISHGDVFVLGSPIYRGAYTGAFKNLLDLVPLEALEGKVVGIVATGASADHYLAIDYQFRGLLAWFNAYVLPGSVYLDNDAYTAGKVTGQQALTYLDQLAKSLVAVAGRLVGIPALPPSLTRRVMQVARK